MNISLRKIQWIVAGAMHVADDGVHLTTFDK